MRSRQGQSDRAQGHERIDCELMNCVGKINTVKTDNYVRQTFRDHIGDKNHDVPISAETEAPNLHWAADVSSINGCKHEDKHFHAHRRDILVWSAVIVDAKSSMFTTQRHTLPHTTPTE